MRIMHSTLAACLAAVALLVAATGCESNAKTDSGKLNVLEADANATMVRAREIDPGIDLFARNAYAYAIYPKVGTGGFILSIGYGDGVVYSDGDLIATSAIKSGGLGATIGGQAYSELLFFENAAALRQFQTGNFKFGATASAVALHAGAAAETKYQSGMALFIIGQSGLMVDASVGGQSFTYNPVD